MDMKARLDIAIDAALGGRIVGCVILVNRGGKRSYSRAAGLADREANRPMAEDAIFRLASVTKPIVATAALRMADLGLLRLDDPVTKYLPWFTPRTADAAVPTITLRQLLSHTSGITYDVPPTVAPGMSGPIQSLETNLRALVDVPLAFAPGTAWAYGMGIDVIGGVLATINGSDVEGVVSRYVTGPLGMADTHFSVTDPGRLAVPYTDGRPPVRMGEPHRYVNEGGNGTDFSPERIFNPAAPQSGGAGMAGTAADIMRLLEALNGGSLLGHETLREATSNQIGDLPRQDAGKRFSLLGALLADPVAARSPCPPGTLDWGGAYGHNWFIDPVNRISIITCTNTTPEGCDGPFREDIRDAVYGEVAAVRAAE